MYLFCFTRKSPNSKYCTKEHKIIVHRNEVKHPMYHMVPRWFTICVYIYTYIHIYIYTYIDIYVYTCAYIHV